MALKFFIPIYISIPDFVIIGFSVALGSYLVYQISKKLYFYYQENKIGYFVNHRNWLKTWWIKKMVYAILQTI